MDITSLPFVAFALASVLAVNAAGRAGKGGVMLLACNLIFIGSFARTVQSLAPIGGFVLLGYFCLIAVEHGRRQRVAATAVVLVVGTFIYLKQYSIAGIFPDIPFVYVLIGVSYILFRIVHLLVDRYQGAIEGPISLVNYLNYILFFPSFISGPIQRYQDFSSSFLTKNLDQKTVYEAFSRILSGYLKTVLLSSVLLQMFSGILASLNIEAAGLTYPGIFTYSAATAAFYLYFYFSFQGYMDIVIGTARLMRIELPENFNNPFAALNFLDFWTRWHITLANWFRTYLFNPLLKFVLQITGWQAGSNYIAVLIFFVTFVTMGVWHGTSNLWLVYGFILGLGVSVNKLYQVVVPAILGRARYRALRDLRSYSAISSGMTFAYVCLAFSAFWPQEGAHSIMSSSVELHIAVLSFVCLSAVFGALYFVVGSQFARLSNYTAATIRGFETELSRNCWLAAKLLTIVGTALLVSSIPETVYKAF